MNHNITARSKFAANACFTWPRSDCSKVAMIIGIASATRLQLAVPLGHNWQCLLDAIWLIEVNAGLERVCVREKHQSNSLLQSIILFLAKVAKWRKKNFAPISSATRHSNSGQNGIAASLSRTRRNSKLCNHVQPQCQKSTCYPLGPFCNVLAGCLS